MQALAQAASSTSSFNPAFIVANVTIGEGSLHGVHAHTTMPSHEQQVGTS